MKILRVEIENFKPYENVVLPQDGRLGDGLFLINGDNSMGKSSLMEAILWGLLGDALIDVRKKSLLVRRGESSCKVDIIFELGGEEYNIIRKMTIRKSRSKKADIQFTSDAVLSKKKDAKFVPLFTGVLPVNREVERLLGITADNIERTVYVRQKEVDKLALAEPKELRELVTGLFGLDEFDRVKSNLSDKASEIQDEIGTLQVEVGSISTEKRELERNESSLKSKKNEYEKKNGELQEKKKELKTFPSESQIVTLKDGIDSVLNREKELVSVKAQIGDKTEYIRTQRSRIKQLEGEIKNFESLIQSDINQLQKIPPSKTLEEVKQIFDAIASIKSAIKKQLMKSKIKFDFDPLASPQKVSQTQLRLDEEIKNMKAQKSDIEKKIKHVESEIASNKTLASMKKDSVSHIESKGNCPVCKSIIGDVKDTIATLSKESKQIKSTVESLEGSKKSLEIEYRVVDEQIETKQNHMDVINKMQLLVEELIDKENTRRSIITDLSKKDPRYSNLSHEMINSLMTKITELETNIRSYNQSMASLKKKIEGEHKTADEYSGQLDILKKKENQLTSEIDKINSELSSILSKFSVHNMDEFLSKFNCSKMEELFAKHKSLRDLILEKEENIGAIKRDIVSLEAQIKQREATLKELSKKADILEKKQTELKHVRFLKGEIDGFISNYIVEGKLAEVLRQTTNSYLTPFTDGRYSIDRIFPTVRRTKGMESHGLEISLIDSKDNMPKFKEQLSGGDETALGLALRIAISKLMARIRPFKDTEIKPPLINSIMLDEPMASLDFSRRRNLVNILTQDQSFKQMFLITHTDMDFGDYNMITVNESEPGKRSIEFKPLQI